MPTGYTHSLYEGKDVSLNEFILDCARAFGALIHMRDESMAVKIEYRKANDSYYERGLEKAQKDLAVISKLSVQHCKKQAEREFKEEIECNANKVKELLKLKERYLNMLNKVMLWEPPTSDHVELKNFMIQQLNDSIKHDCDVEYYQNIKSVQLTGSQWKKNKLKRIKDDIKYYTEELNKEIQRCKEANDWIDQLFHSLGLECGQS